MTTLDDVLRSLDVCCIPEELTGSPRAVLDVAAQEIRAWRRVPGRRHPALDMTSSARDLGRADSWLAVGFATLARGNVTAARRLFGRVIGDAAPESAEALLARIADLLAAHTGYAFLPGGGSNLRVAEATFRLNALEMTAELDTNRLWEARAETWWPPVVTLLNQVMLFRRGVLGPYSRRGGW